MSEQSFEACITRLFTIDKNGIAGTGFLVGDKHILTCAHVINGVLGIPDTTVKKPTEIIWLDFPFVANGGYLKAKIIVWHPVSTNKISDIAILELLDAIPNNYQSTLTLKNHESGHSFRAYGFPHGHYDGIWVEGKIKHELSNGRIQIDGDKQGSVYGIAPGFSGGPVWDDSENGIVGMVVVADNRTDNSIAFFIPTNILIKAWKELRQHCRRSQKPESIPSYLLPYFPDRDKQIWKLRDAIKKRAEKFPNEHRPLLCLIHGDEYQCHGRLVERFVSDSKIIPKQMIDSDVRAAKYLRLPNSVDDFSGRILAGLEDLPEIPFVLYSEIYTEDWQYHGKTDIIRDFIEFWANFDTPTPPLLVCLCFNYRQDEKYSLTNIFHHYINYKIRCVFNDLESKHPDDVVVLPELFSVEKKQVEDWAETYINNHLYEIKPYIRDLFSKRKKIAMEPLARQLRQILNECRDKGTFQT